MIWSISTYKEFQRCQRKWYLNHKVASRSLKDSFRREIHFLSELESIDSWRGKIADYTISEFIIPKLNKKQTFAKDEVIDYAKKVARARYNFAKGKRYRDVDLKKTEHNYDYAAIYDFEYNNSDNNLSNKFKIAMNEAETALTNFMNNIELIEKLKSAEYLVKQRNLKFKFHDITVQAVPDLIAFFTNKPPLIADWKVHYFGTKTFNEQLLVYSFALKSCNPHKDFPALLNNYSITDIDLLEYQLLKNIVRSYKTDEDHIEFISDYIAGGINLMKRKKCDEKYEKLDINDFDKTYYIDACLTCSFKKICKEY